jgi:peptidoglycan/LPS O-acetylase OafA/YrhL
MDWAGLVSEITDLKRIAYVPFLGAVGFYAFLPLLLIPKIRREFVRLFSPAQPVSQTQIKPLDALRGLAAIGIASFHTWVWLRPYFDSVADSLPLIKQSYKSVPVFVVLSGFLIYRSIREFSQLEDLRYYVKRRVLRIYPLYIVSVLVYFALADVRPAPASWFQRILPEVFMMKVFGYSTYIYPSYWSLYVEELFYLAAPLWVVMTRGWPLLSAYAGFALFSLVGSAVPDDLAIIKYFFVGIIVCELLDTKEIKRLSQQAAAAILAAGMVLLVAEGLYGDLFGKYVGAIAGSFGVKLIFDRGVNPADIYNHYYSITLGVAIALVMLGVIQFRLASRFLSWFPFRFLGAISFSVFVWNGLIILQGTNLYLNTFYPTISQNDTAFPQILRGGWVSFFGVYLASFVFFGAISYLAIERPFLLLRRKRNALIKKTLAQQSVRRRPDLSANGLEFLFYAYKKFSGREDLNGKSPKPRDH